MTGTVPDGLTHINSGKVRELYRTRDGKLLLVASDRISVYDHIVPTPIPDKGRVLTAMTAFWLGMLAEVVPNHVIAVDHPAIPEEWRGRAMLCRELDMIPVEAVARGYITGMGYQEYKEKGTVSGIELPTGLRDGDRLAEPIFTPATKAAHGEHDENISYEKLEARIGPEIAEELRRVTLAAYRRAGDMAAARGIIIADTKFEFGLDEAGRLILADEVLTPDSSRFWPADQWLPGQPQPSFDKQYLRNWLTSPESGWDRNSGEPPPELPPHVVAATRQRYIDAYDRLTGNSFAEWHV